MEYPLIITNSIPFYLPIIQKIFFTHYICAKEMHDCVNTIEAKMLKLLSESKDTVKYQLICKKSGNA